MTDRPALGLLETNSIALGIEAVDVMLKASDVTLLDARPVSPGKFLSFVSGENGPVETAIEEGKWHAGSVVVDSTIIPRVHEAVLAGIRDELESGLLEAVGILETFSVASLVQAADAAVKEADVRLVQMRLAVGLGGKAYFAITGMIGPVSDAMRKAEKIARDSGLLHSSILIPHPHAELAEILSKSRK